MSALGIRTIIVATDLTDALLPTLQSAAQLAQLTDADLHIVHTTQHEISESLLHTHLRAADISLNNNTQARIMVGPPGAAITQEAVRLQADVIVLGPHRAGSPRLGSTAYRVVRGAQVPCLMLPQNLQLPLRKVLVPLDISAPARGALAVALTWASALRERAQGAAGTELIALHVAPDEPVTGDQNPRARLKADVESVRSTFAEFAGVALREEIESGAPARVILQRARSADAGLIVMGTRGHQPQQDFLGSVSLEVVTRATQPVLLVPPSVWQHA
jgi:nucleotide-binding universal stress UspA family protein